MKNLATWLLAAAFTTAALPAFAVEPSVQVGYSPEGSARVLVLSAIDSAKTSIRMMAYSFTAPDIMKALVAAKKRGVDVKIVIDERGNTGRASIRPYGDERSNAIPFMAITETFQFSSSRSVLSRSSVERPHRESSVTRIASICLDWASARTFFRSARSSLVPEPVSLNIPTTS